MIRSIIRAAALLSLAVPAAPQPITHGDLMNAAKDTSAWLSYGRDFHAQRYVELNQITTANVKRLRPAWVFATGGENRGLQATPLLYKGTLYLSADGSRVFAIDARTGARKWMYDPKPQAEAERVYCCGIINRGVAMLGEYVYVGTIDARLVALHRETGEVAWESKVADWQKGYSITGAPLALKDMVLTGVAGGEFGIRGFVKAFDAKTGEERWTTYTIPGPGEPGNETWPGETWKNGGGPTWTTGAFDPALNLVYWNTGNAGPWNCQVRKGDNKWTAATIAMNADTGKIEWGFQYTPWDCWDYDAVSTPVLADVTLPKHGPVKALFHHDKNGFFYALDRTSGKFLYGDAIVPNITWASGLDPETGRPKVNPAMIATTGGPEVGPIIPSLEGAIDWQPLAYDPSLRYLFFMSNQWAMGYKFWELDKLTKPMNGEWYLGADYQQYMSSNNPGNFVAYDVVNRKVVWRSVSPAPFWAGAVATSSGLVFTGDMRGYFMAFEALTGKVLWRFQTGSGIAGSPITYQLDGVQYVAAPSGGIGGDMTFYYKEPRAGNLWVFALDGGPDHTPPDSSNLMTIKGRLPRVGQPGSTLGGRVLPGYGFPATEGGAPIPGEEPLPQPTGAAAPAGDSDSAGAANPLLGNADAIAAGESLYRSRCFGCHGANGGNAPRLFRTRLTPGSFADVVNKGRPGTAMPRFSGLLSTDEIWQIHALLVSRDRL
ncbi:MAG: PQQ-dependent dehydrogenase, methanol/ethanol family [Bryobacteraceae bacterium]